MVPIILFYRKMRLDFYNYCSVLTRHGPNGPRSGLGIFRTALILFRMPLVLQFVNHLSDCLLTYYSQP
jgi:hypothetical protein